MSPAAHDAVEVIIAKRDGGELSDSQIDWVIDAYTRGEVADEQMASLAMAILLNGMNRREIARWTGAMIASGERMDFSSLSRPTADKHSTGGVGDKITLPLAPLVAACGVAVPQLSGRGLGHTGGTLDKLESIPGWRAALSNEEMFAQLESVGAVICAAGDELAPADKKLYALRDVTGTVEAIPLIASSIMSKKIAEGTGALVLDVKVGTGAFMKDVDRARELAEVMVGLGTDAGVHTVALLTDMSTPLGLTAGNGIEVRRVGRGAGRRRPRRRGRADPGAGPRDARRRRPRRHRPRRQAGRRLGDGRVEGDDPRPGRRPRRGAAGGQGVARGRRAVVRRADPARRDGGRAGRVAARRRPGPQGGPGAGGCRRRSGTPAPVTRSPKASRCFTLLTDEPARFDRALASLEGGYDIADAAAYRPNPLLIDRVRLTAVSARQEHHGLGHARRLGLVLDLDRVLERDLAARGDLGDLAHRHVRPDPLADPDGVREPHLVDAVVELRRRASRG